VEFLRTRLDEDEQVARDASSHPARDDGHELHVIDDDYKHDAIRIPAARVLADVEAKRRVVGLHRELIGETRGGDRVGEGCVECDSFWPCDTLRLLVLPYAQHPDYREEWKP